MKLHKLKTIQSYFSEVKYKDGKVENYYKKFEYRKWDRDFQNNDILLLLEYEPVTGVYSGDGYFTQINYIFCDVNHIPYGHVILGLHPICLDIDGEDLLNNDIDYKQFLELNEEDCLEKLFEIMYSKNVGCYTKALEWKKNEK